MTRTWKDEEAPRVRRRADTNRRKQRKARQLSMRFATEGKIPRVLVPRDLPGRLEVLYR